MDIFAPELYRDVRKPLSDASTLPPHVYYSPEWYAEEVKTIFRKSWLVAARADEIPNPGDYLRVDFFGEPLIVIRGSDNIVRTLSASCRHRGSELLTGSGNCRSIVCPYHAWTYSLAGELVGAPSMSGVHDFQVSQCRLPTLRTELWGGFVFINFDSSATPLVESLGELAPRFAGYRLEEMRIVRKWTFRVNCNWKIWAENSREAYHLATVHRPSMERYRPSGYKIEPFKAKIEQKKYCINSGPIGLSFGVPEKPTFSFHQGISEYDRSHAHYLIWYPHLIMNLQPDKMVYHQLFPEGPEAMTMSYVMCFPRDTIERADFAKTLPSYLEPAEMAFTEDRQICESQQRGLKARLASQGRFSVVEEPSIHALANYVLDRVLDGNS